VPSLSKHENPFVTTLLNASTCCPPSSL
jgi:hypothetical protein